jgi:predicted transposase YdaD
LRRVRRIYLDELKIPGGAPPALAILQLTTSAQDETFELVSRLMRRARHDPEGAAGQWSHA